MRNALLLVVMTLTLPACDGDGGITESSLPRLVDCLAGDSAVCSSMNGPERRVYECSIQGAKCNELSPDEQRLLVDFERKKPRREIKLPTIKLR
jgi:hypothetical protein